MHTNTRHRRKKPVDWKNLAKKTQVWDPITKTFNGQHFLFSGLIFSIFGRFNGTKQATLKKLLTDKSHVPIIVKTSQ